MRLLAVVMLCTAVAGCATQGTSIPIAPERSFPATLPQEVLILTKPPTRQHEVIALVEGVASTDDYLSERRTQIAALNAMRMAAARIGAHAIVLTAQGREPYARAISGGGAASYNAGVLGNSVLGSAYYTATETAQDWPKIAVAGTALRFVPTSPDAQ